MTTLAPRPVPLDPGAIDLVVIDEASQCSIASIVPLLLRARRALVIGDPMQLPHIAKLTERTDAQLRARHGISRDWIGFHRLSPVRHSAFDAAARAAGEPLLLNEHYRCAPAIAGLANKLFYQGRLDILTDSTAPDRLAVSGSAIEWHDVPGDARRGERGRSWVNDMEVDAVVDLSTALDAELPRTASVGVVTPFRAQASAIESKLEGTTRTITVGTAHRFQGGERDVMIFSLVGGDGMPSRTLDWFDQQRELWNVAITRARSRLIVVGDARLWEGRSVTGRHLLRAARSAEAVESEPLDDDTADLLHDAVAAAATHAGDGWSVSIGDRVHGYRCESVLGPDGRSRPIVLDTGVSDGSPAVHLDLALRRTALLGPDEVRLPVWTLSSPADLAELLAGDFRAHVVGGPASPDHVHRSHPVGRPLPEPGHGTSGSR